MKYILLFIFTFSGALSAQNNIAFLHVAEPATGKTAPSSATYSTSQFELSAGMIIVSASINDQSGHFILDTGAPGIVLNARQPIGTEQNNATGMDGNIKVGTCDILEFEWGIIRQQNFQAYTLDISHLEKACGRQLMGLIGFDVLQHHEILFDFPNKTVKVFSAADPELRQSKNNATAIPFHRCGHIPVIKARVGGRALLLGLDSGAGVNVLDAELLEKMDTRLLFGLATEEVTGLGNQTTSVRAATLRSSSVKKRELPPMRFVFADLTVLREKFGVSFDGLLGFPFFQNQAISVNYRENKMYIWN
jgi:hypothetical protein